MSKELAVLVPTRSRPHNVPDIVESWWATGAFNDADLIFIVDSDDPEYEMYMELISRFPETVQRFVFPDWQPLVPKLNRVAIKAAGEYKYVAFMGDDHMPRTPMWTNKLITDHAIHGGGIVYGRDGIQDQRLCTWWSMDSRIINALGRMVPADVQHMYCDNSVMMLGERAGRLLYDPDVYIEHMHPIAGKAVTDEQYLRVNRREQYERDEVSFRAWAEEGLARDATLIADIWG